MNNEALNSDKFNLDRLNALSDGVIAIALTLLVLGIDIPTDHNFNEDGLVSFLIKLEPGIIAYLSSFIIISIYWILHHRVYNILKFSNGSVLLLNIIFLLAISLIPFVAKIKSLYPFDPLVVVIFAFAHIFTGLVLFTTWKHLMAHPDLCKTSMDKKKNKTISLILLMIPIISLIAVLFSFINIHVASYLFLAIPILFILISRLVKS